MSSPSRKRRPVPDVRVNRPAVAVPDGVATDDRRRLLADFCRLVERQLRPDADLHPPANGDPSALDTNGHRSLKIDALRLTPRQRQVLALLVRGDAEKQVANKLGVSRNTVHAHVKELYKSLGVNSRGELLARFIEFPAG